MLFYYLYIAMLKYQYKPIKTIRSRSKVIEIKMFNENTKSEFDVAFGPNSRKRIGFLTRMAKAEIAKTKLQLKSNELLKLLRDSSIYKTEPNTL